MEYISEKQDIIEIGRRMYNRNFVASNDGNISVKVSENELIITPTGVSKGYMKPEDMIRVDMNGRVLSGDRKPSSEMKMHLAVYRNRPDVYAVCHAHPQKATAFAVARQVCKEIALPEVIFSIGNVALSDYATPSTDEVPNSIENIIKTTDAILLSNHGALTVGKDLFDAYYKMETLEHFAGIILYARLLGGEHGLTPQQVNQLFEVRKNVFGKSDYGYLGDGYCGGSAVNEAKSLNETSIKDEKDLVRVITELVIKELTKAN